MTFALLYGALWICFWALDSVLYRRDCFIIEVLVSTIFMTHKIYNSLGNIQKKWYGGIISSSTSSVYMMGFYLLWYSSSVKKKKKLKFSICLQKSSSVVLNCSYFWFCLLNCSIYTHNLYSKEYSTLLKPLSNTGGVFIIAFCASIVFSTRNP